MGMVVSLAEVRGTTTNFERLVNLAKKIQEHEYEEGVPRGKLLVFNDLLKQEIEVDSCRTNLEKWLEVAKRIRPELKLEEGTRTYVVVRLALTPHVSAGRILARFQSDNEAYMKFQRFCEVMASFGLN